MKKKVTLMVLAAMLCLPAMRAQKTEKSVLAPRLQELYQQADCPMSKKYRKAPVIGITTILKGINLSIPYSNIQSVIMAGGIPLLIPSTDDVEVLDAYVGMIDALLLPGGADIDPSYYGHEAHPQLGEVNHERDVFELLLFRKAHALGMPIFGICRGMQMINVAMGGTLWQDIPSDFQSDINHRVKENTDTPAHNITITPKTRSAKVFGTTSMGVNTLHHQCVRDVAPGLAGTAWATDSVPEMLEGYPEQKILATQWHPEIFAAKGDKQKLKYFLFLVKEAKAYAKQKRKR